MRYFTLFLFFASALFANTIVTENDPSTLVNGVSVITGDLYTFEEDYRVEGVEPISIRRAYLSSKGDWTPYPHLFATHLIALHSFEVIEPNGTAALYSGSPRDKKKGKHEPIRFDVSESCSIGVANTASGKIAAQTNFKNQYLLVDPDGKSFVVCAASGAKRYYRELKNQKKANLGFGQKGYLIYRYAIQSETLPNGNKIQYQWDNENRLESITTVSLRGKQLAQVIFPKWKPEKPPAEYRIAGSDGRSLCYKSGYLDLKKEKHWNLRSIHSPNSPTESFARIVKKIRRGQAEEKTPFLESVSLPMNRIVHVEYEEAQEKGFTFHRVKKLLSPLEKDAALHVAKSFAYYPEQKQTHIFDAQGNKTAYFWDANFHLTQIDFFGGSDLLHHSEKFVWGGTNLRCKAFFDEERRPIQARVFIYDEKNNVKEEAFFGNLSGQGPPLQMGEDGLPLKNGVESCVKKTDYTSDERNLPLRQEDSNGLVTLYDYIPGTHLLKSKFLCDGEVVKIRYFYEYNEDLILVREIVDDGMAKTIRQITPKRDAPYYGMPEIIEEKYEDNGQEILLRKTVLSYGPGARVEKKEVYDANGVYRYSIKMAYDDKGRLILETNPMGWETVSRYDDVGNKIYCKDVSGNETTFDYDFSNRLTKKEEKGFDGTTRVFHYEYDSNHNLVLETDAYGQETWYVPTPFGQRTEIHLPPTLEASPVLKSTFDSAGNETIRTDADGFTTQMRHNPYGKPTWVKHPDGGEESYTYYVDGALKTHTDAMGVLTEYERDYLGHVLKKTISHNHETLSVETAEYTGQQLTTKTDAEGHKTLLSYDRAGRKIAEELEMEKILFYYDSLNRCHIGEKGNLRTISHYDLLDRLEEQQEEDISSGKLLRKSVCRYDRAGNKTHTFCWVEGSQTQEQSEYDSQNRLKWKIDPSGAKEIISYNDAFHNELGQTVLQKTHTDPLGLETIETFDALGRVSKIEKRKNRTLRVVDKRYNARGKAALQIDTIFAPDGASRVIRTRWEYDECSRPTLLVEAEGTPEEKVTQNSYTLRGEKRTTRKPDGTILRYEYDGLGSLLSITSSDGSVCHEMRYNRLGHLIWSDGIEREVDFRGRLLAEIFPQDYRIENSFNSSGQRSECRIPIANCLIEYTHNGLDLLEVSRKTMRGTELYTHRYGEHDLSGNLQESELPNHLGRVQYRYDTCSRRLLVAAPGYLQQVLQADSMGNIWRMQTQGGESSFDYDELYQITSEHGVFNHDYQCDSLHARLKKDDELYQINSLNQPISHIEYDRNGNPKRQGETFYTFDALDRLIQITTPQFTQTFTYDSQHRRLSALTNQKIRFFLYDGQNEIGALNEKLEVEELRILGDAPHAEIGAAIGIELHGKAYAPIHDLSGNLAALLPLDGGPIEITQFSAFGEQTGSHLSPWSFSSKRLDATGLIYYGRRFYQPDFGQWLSPDPAGFTDGMNLYAFVGNCPLTHFDEYGLFDFNQNEWDLSNSQQSLPWMHSMSDRFTYQSSPPISKSAILPSLTPDSTLSRVYCVNGINNTVKECISSAEALKQSLGGRVNVCPAYSETFGFFKDLGSVYESRSNPNYSTPFIRMLKQSLLQDIRSLEAANSLKKIFIDCFSRGSTDTYHAVKDFTRDQKDRLIIISCGGIKMLPRDLGFAVINLVSKGDWCSLHFNSELKKNPKAYDSWADVVLLKQKDGFKGFIKDHFALSRTYQDGIKEHGQELYQTYGGDE